MKATKYELLKKRLQACIDSPLKDESLCDATSILEEIANTDDLLVDEKGTLMEMYYLVKAKAENPLRTDKK